MPMPTMNAGAFGGIPNAIPEADPMERHAQNVREGLMRERAKNHLREQLRIQQMRPPLHDPVDFTKAVMKKPAKQQGQQQPAGGGRQTFNVRPNQQMLQQQLSDAANLANALSANRSGRALPEDLLSHHNPNVAVAYGANPYFQGYGDMPGTVVPPNGALAAKQRIDRQRLRLNNPGFGNLLAAGRPQPDANELAVAEMQSRPGHNTLTPREYLAQNAADKANMNFDNIPNVSPEDYKAAHDRQWERQSLKRGLDAYQNNQLTDFAKSDPELARAPRQAMLDANREKYLAGRPDANARKLALATAAAKRRTNKGGVQTGDTSDSPKLVNIDPMMAYYNPAAFQAAVDWNHRESERFANRAESKADRESREKLAGMEDTRLREAENNATTQRDQQFKERMAAIQDAKEDKERQFKEAMAKDDHRAAAEAFAASERLEHLKQQTIAAQKAMGLQEAANQIEREKLKAQSGPLTPREIAATPAENLDFLEQNGMLPPNTLAPKGGKKLAKPDWKDVSAAARKAIKDNLHNPLGAADQLAETTDLTPDEADEIIKEQHPLGHRYDRRVAQVPFSGLFKNPNWFDRNVVDPAFRMSPYMFGPKGNRVLGAFDPEALQRVWGIR